jgi:hypothetical protein
MLVNCARTPFHFDTKDTALILRDRPSGLDLFLALRGSVLPRILPALLVSIAIATLVTCALVPASLAPGYACQT